MRLIVVEKLCHSLLHRHYSFFTDFFHVAKENVMGQRNVCVGDVGPSHRAKVLPCTLVLLGSLAGEQRAMGRLNRECKVPKEGSFLNKKKLLKVLFL